MLAVDRVIAFSGVLLGIIGGGLIIAIVVIAIVFRRSEHVQIKVDVHHDIDEPKE
jgi:hypothetical protein